MTATGGRWALHGLAPLGILLMLLGATLLQGCSTRGDPNRAPPPIADRAPEAAVVDPVVELPVPQSTVAVVLSSHARHYRDVADALGVGPWRRYVLTDGHDDAVREAIRAAGHRAAIAVGQRALALLAPMRLRLVHCQVFEPAAAEAAAARGVAALPEAAAQLDAWLSHQPGLQGIGLITGPAHAQVAERLAEAAEQRGLVLHRAVVQSDRELLYVFRRMVPAIQGFLLYPDTAVLSPGAIRELLGYARKHGVRVSTYNRVLFELGADLLMTADPAEVADRVVDLLEAEGAQPSPVPLQRVVVEAAAGMAAPAGDAG